jgi:hypothetical protein
LRIAALTASGRQATSAIRIVDTELFMFKPAH